MNFVARRSVWILLVPLAGCGTEPVLTQQVPGPEVSPAFETIASGTSSGYDSAADVPLPDVTLFAIRTRAEWEEFWMRHQSNVRPVPAAPDVDFGRHTIVAVVDRVENSGGYTVEVREIETTPRERVVRIEHGSPGPDCGVWLALSQPYHIVLVPKADVPVVSEVIRIEIECQ